MQTVNSTSALSLGFGTISNNNNNSTRQQQTNTHQNKRSSMLDIEGIIDEGFLNHLIKTQLQIGSGGKQNLKKGGLTSSSQPINSLPLSPPHKHYHSLMMSRNSQIMLPPIQSPYNNFNIDNNFNAPPKIGNLSSSVDTISKPNFLKKQQSRTLTPPTKKSIGKLRISIDNSNIQNGNSSKHYREPEAPMSARVRKSEPPAEWKVNKEYVPKTPPNLTSLSKPMFGVSEEGSDSPRSSQHERKWNCRIDRKLRDLEFYYSGGPTRVCHMKYLDDTEEEPGYLIKEQEDTIIALKKKEKQLAENKTKRRHEKIKRMDKINQQLNMCKRETRKTIAQVEKKQEQLDFLQRLCKPLEF